MGIAIITGASSGLGREFAIQLDQLPSSERPEEFYLIARREEALRETAAMLKAPSRIFAWDLLDEENQVAYAQILKDEQTSIRYLVNNAGFGKIGAVTEIPLEVQRQMLRLNAELPLVISNLSAPYLEEGAIVFQIASVAAFLPQPYFAVYAATKSFVHSFSRALAQEWKKRGIQVISVCPNPMETEFFQVAGSEEKSSRIKQIGVERVEQVVATAIRKAKRGSDVSLASFFPQGIRLASRLLPHRWIFKMEEWMGIWPQDKK